MAYPKSSRRRTVLMPEERSKAIRLAAEYLGLSGEGFIQAAITDELRVTYERMLNELP
jgi:hypothetical protein